MGCLYRLKGNKAWVVVGPRKYVFIFSVKDTRSESIREFERDSGRTWGQWYYRGFRCVKVTLMEGWQHEQD